jgi:Leucine-rich repeat (LRR) protein
MSSESPGNIGKREMLNRKKANPKPGDKNKCLPILPSSSLQERLHFSPSKTSKRNSNTSNVIRPPHRHLHHPPLLLLLLPLLLLLNLVPYAAADGFCSPLLCSCQVETANCSSRGFPTMPGGLGKTLKILNLAQNDLQSVNATELGMYPLLEELDLSRNQISSLQVPTGPLSSSLVKLDLAHNRITSLR